MSISKSTSLTPKVLTHDASKCESKLSYNFSDDGTSITGVTVTANSNTCDVPIPIIFPRAVTAQTEGQDIGVKELGSEPLVVWTKLNGEAVTFTLDEPMEPWPLHLRTIFCRQYSFRSGM